MSTITTAEATVLSTGRQQTAAEAGEHARLALVVCGLGAIMALAWGFRLENPAFYRWVLPLACGGAVVHHWLPRRLQAWFFSALGATAVLIVLGPKPGAWLIGLGLGLIALCHVPIAFRWRAAIVAAAGVGLMLARMGRIVPPWPGVIWPVFASMFMFRLGIYLYDLKHYGRSAPAMVLSYFFLLPNVVFLLFPVIDFHTFRRTYYDRRPVEIYEEGVRWILRGMTHLVGYRLLYQLVVIPPSEVVSTAGIVRYLVSNYGLYLHISGQFHIIVGILHLFGFRLPQTHRFFYLASSFSDLWRRINIYWKDFMQKMVYLPTVIGLKRRGETPALVGGTLAVVAATWFLHSFQWFWLLGVWLFSATDMLFWAILGVFLVVNTLREQRKGRTRQLTSKGAANPWREAVQTVGMFGLMCLLWGFWTSPTMPDFWSMLRAATWRRQDAVALAATVGTVAIVAYGLRRWGFGMPSAKADRRGWWQHPLLTNGAPLAIVWIAGGTVIARHIPAQIQAVAREARNGDLNAYEAERQQRGYYEKLTNVNAINGHLWEMYAREDPELIQGWEGLFAAGGLQGDPLNPDIRANFSTIIKGGRLSTNRWGFRDRDYEMIPSANTRRIAVLGASYVLGLGVNDGETFEALVEDRLNREWSPKTGLKYELLNFGIGGYSLPQQANLLRRRVGLFKPDVVLLVTNVADTRNTIRQVGRIVHSGSLLSDPVSQWVRDVGLRREMSDEDAMRLLGPYEDRLLQWAMSDIATETRRMGARPIMSLIPLPLQNTETSKKEGVLSAASAAGFDPVIDMQNTFAGRADRASLTVSDLDRHPNLAGHRAIAERLLTELTGRPALLTPWEDRDRALRATLQERWAPRAPEERKMDSWRLEAHQGSQATLVRRREPDRLRVALSTLTGSEPWLVKLRQAPMEIVERHAYRLSFRVRADKPRPVGFGMERNHEPWDLLSRYEWVDAGPEWKDVRLAFDADESETNARMFFNLGKSSVPAEFSNIELMDLTTGLEVGPSIVNEWKLDQQRKRAARKAERQRRNAVK